MQDRSKSDAFISATTYQAPVDIKKLRFVFTALERYVAGRGMEFEDLRILEVACGEGGITLPLASLGCRVAAFDIDEKAVASLRKRLEGKGTGTVSVTVDNGFTFDDGKVYDVVIASEVFEHVLDPAGLARNIVRRMKEGSYLIVTTPNRYGPWELRNRMDIRGCLRRWNALRRLLGKAPYARGGPDHCQFYSKSRLVGLFSEFSLGLVDFAKSDSFLTVFPPLRRSASFGKLDTKLADILPYWIASGWYFVFQLRGSRMNESG